MNFTEWKDRSIQITVAEESIAKAAWNAAIEECANVCVHCGKVPETYYITAGHDHTDDSIRYCFCRSVAPSIEQLQAKVAELEEEIERLRADNIAFARNLKGKSATTGATYEHICTQLAAEQLNNKRLREALEAVIKVHGYESGIPVEAISTQANTEALDKYVDEKVKGATTGHVEDIRFKNKEIEELRRIKMARFNNEDCWIYQGDGEDHLESLSCPVVVYPSVLIELTKQRDLAVEALEWIASSLPQIGVERVWMLDHANKTLAAIKESDGK